MTAFFTFLASLLITLIIHLEWTNLFLHEFPTHKHENNPQTESAI